MKDSQRKAMFAKYNIGDHVLLTKKGELSTKLAEGHEGIVLNNESNPLVNIIGKRFKLASDEIKKMKKGTDYVEATFETAGTAESIKKKLLDKEEMALLDEKDNILMTDWLIQDKFLVDTDTKKSGLHLPMTAVVEDGKVKLSYSKDDWNKLINGFTGRSGRRHSAIELRKGTTQSMIFDDFKKMFKSEGGLNKK